MSYILAVSSVCSVATVAFSDCKSGSLHTTYLCCCCCWAVTCADNVSTCFVVLQSILFIQHTCLASMLRFWLPEGVFNTLDGFATSFELLCYGKKACKQYKKRLRRHAMKVSCLAQLPSQFVFSNAKCCYTAYVMLSSWSSSHCGRLASDTN